ncbi:MFS transporter [Kineococcus sp. GCM10028916]|uniref:MFS transporter n=1 Tax=Kineococcus sp. GCM10028916 TaxID=3273394 RepID=UPI0036445BF6
MTTTVRRSRRPLTGLLTAHAISLTGNMLTLIALPLYVLAQTGSAALTGLTGAVATVPVILGGALGGVLVDRAGYRRTSVVADLVGAVTIAAVPLLHHSSGLPFWALLVLVFATGLLDTPGQTARRALLPEAATAAAVPLERAVGWMEATERGARLVGAPLAGLLVAAVGALNVLAWDAATFVAAAVVVLSLVPAGRPQTWAGPAARPDDGSEPTASTPPTSPSAELEEPDSTTSTTATPADGPRAGYWRELREGVSFLWRERLLRSVVGLVLVTNLFDAAKSSVLLPVTAQRDLGGSVAFGLIVGTMGGGALIGSLLFGAIGHRLPRRATFVTAFVLAGAPPHLALATGLPLPAIVAVTALSGLAAGAINPIIGIIELERVPPGMRARVYGVIGAGAWAGMPLGSLAAGFAVDHLGLRPTLYSVGIAYLLVVLTPLLGGPWESMNAPAASHAQNGAVAPTS